MSSGPDKYVSDALSKALTMIKRKDTLDVIMGKDPEDTLTFGANHFIKKPQNKTTKD